MVGDLLARLTEASVTGGIGFAIVWTLCRALPRLPASWRANLWRLCLLKFALGAFVAIPIAIDAQPLAAPSRLEGAPETHPTGVIPASVGETRNSPSEPFEDTRDFPAVNWPTILTGVWGFVAIAGALQVGRSGWAAYHRCRRGTRVTDDRLAEAVSRYDARLTCRIIPNLASPVLIGRTILMPTKAQGWPLDVLDAAIAHEAAHFARRDAWGSVFAAIVCRAFWFHPLAWLAAREMRLEAEVAADDLAREWLGVSPREYGRRLLTLLASPPRRNWPWDAAPAALGASHELARRILLSNRKRYLGRARWTTGALLLLPLTLGLIPVKRGSQSKDPSGWVVVLPVPSSAVHPLLPTVRDQARWLASDLRSVSSSLNADALRSLKRSGLGGATQMQVPGGGRIELFGLSHLEPGRSRSWSASGTPLPHLLPFAPTGPLVPTPPAGAVEIPVPNGTFERQAVLRYQAPITGLQGFFRVQGPRGGLSNTCPVPLQSSGDHLLVVQQGFGDPNLKQADLVLHVFREPVVFARAEVRQGTPVPRPQVPPTTILPGNALDIHNLVPRPGPVRLVPHPVGSHDTLVAIAPPTGVSLRVVAVDRQGRAIRLRKAQRVERDQDTHWIPSVSLDRVPPEQRSLWVAYGVRPSELAEIRYASATEQTVTFKNVQLHPRG